MSKIYEAKYRIYYEDTDAGGVVYYANYLKFFERARTDLFRENNIFQTELLESNNIVFVVSKCNIKYKKGARLDDLVTIKTKTTKVGEVSISWYQEMFLGDELLNNLEVKIGCVDATSMKPTKIPVEIVKKIQL